MCEASKEVTWMRHLLESIGCEQDRATKLNCDNQGAIKLVHSHDSHKRTNHIDVKNYYIREKREDGTVEVVYVNVKDQLADILTKPLNGPIYKKLRDAIGVGPWISF